MLMSPMIALLSIVLPAVVHAEDANLECERQLLQEQSEGGYVCCPMWKAANCRLDHLTNNTSTKRDLAIADQRYHLIQSGCSAVIQYVGDGMPLSCYWRYRKWIIMTTVVVGCMALLVIVAVLIATYHRRVAHRRRSLGRQGSQPVES